MRAGVDRAYRIVGKDSARALGKAWTKRSHAPDG